MDNDDLDSIREDRRRQHLRFDMSGFGQENDCNVRNNQILKHFVNCGIYDYVHFLWVDFYKGSLKIFSSWWIEEENLDINDIGCGAGTVEIIDIILLTYAIKPRLADMPPRRYN